MSIVILRIIIYFNHKDAKFFNMLYIFKTAKALHLATGEIFYFG